MDRDEMIALAWQASERAYSPYSGFRVGACLLAESGQYYLGCNIENSSFGATNCAERTAFFTAIAAGEQHFQAIAIVGERADGSGKDDFAYPCGICRQVMLEFCDPSSFRVILGSRTKAAQSFLLQDLMPHSFHSF